MADDPITFGAYRLYEQIGRGGMATVWLATREGSSDLCVLKRLRGDRDLDRDVPARFVREAHLCTLLDHPNIARVVDAGRVDDDFFIAFEYVSGISVYDVLRALHPKKQVLPFAITVAIAEQLLDGLAFAHTARDGDGAAMNLVHRDLSPANVMLGFDGRVKVIDFGVASAQVDALKTSPGKVFGTMRYMSPDQALGRPLDARSDLYTVGVVLYEMLCGAPVIPRSKKLAWKDAFKQILETWPAPLAEAAPLVPRSLAFAVERAFAKAPEDRWPDAESMREAVVSGSAELGRVNREGLSRFLQQHFETERLDREALFLRVAALAGVPELEPVPTRTGVLPQGPDPQMIATRSAPLEEVYLVTRTAEPALTEAKTRPAGFVTSDATGDASSTHDTPTTADSRPSLDVTPSLPTLAVRAERRRVPWAVFGGVAIVAAGVTAGIARWQFEAPAPIRIAEAPRTSPTGTPAVRTPRIEPPSAATERPRIGAPTAPVERTPRIDAPTETAERPRSEPPAVAAERTPRAESRSGPAERTPRAEALSVTAERDTRADALSVPTAPRTDSRPTAAGASPRTPSATPRITPRPAPADPAEPDEPDEAAPRPEPTRGRARVAPPPADPLAELLRELEANPRDADLQAQLYGRLVAAARVLPDAARRQRAESAARRARRSGSLRAFTEAVTLVSGR
ncbi:MAG: protein kinase [Deltaproteobacteria bacterium]